MILITHDLGVVAEIADRVLVMYRGMGVEECRTASLFDEPLHPYSQGLLSSRPSNFNGRYSAIPGTVKQNYGVFKGCPYSDRCPYALEDSAVTVIWRRAQGSMLEALQGGQQ